MNWFKICLIVAVLNPANGKLIGSVPDMDATDTENAIKVAYKAFQSWKETTAKVCTVVQNVDRYIKTVLQKNDLIW